MFEHNVFYDSCGFSKKKERIYCIYREREIKMGGNYLTAQMFLKNVASDIYLECLNFFKSMC